MIHQEAPQKQKEMPLLSPEQIKQFREELANLLLDFMTDPRIGIPDVNIPSLPEDSPDIIQNGGKIDRSVLRALTSDSVSRTKLLKIFMKFGIKAGETENIYSEFFN